jgi:hypothetical protein
MADIEFGLRLTADGGVFINNVRLSEEAANKFAAALQKIQPAAQQAEQSLTGSIVKGNLLVDMLEKAAHAAVDFFEKTVSGAADLNNLSQITGSTVESISKLQNSFRISGNENQLAGALTRMSAGLSGMDEGAQRASRQLAALGITTRDPATALEQLARKLEEYTDGSNKATAVQNILGRGMQSLIPALHDYAEGMKTGSVTTTKQAEDAERLEKSWRELTTQGGELKTFILSSLVPAINEVIRAFREGTQAAGGFGAAIAFNAALGGRDPGRRAQELEQEIAELKAGQSTLANPLIGAMTENFRAGQIASREAQVRFYRQQALQRTANTYGGGVDPRDEEARIGRPEAPVVPQRTGGAAPSINFADINRDLRLAEQAYASLFALQKQEGEQALAVLEAWHQQGIVSEQTYINRRAAIQTQGVEDEIAKIEGERDKQAAALNAAAQRIQQQGGRAAFQDPKNIAELDTLQQGLVKSATDLALAYGKLGDIKVFQDLAEGARRFREETALIAVARDLEDYNRRLSEQGEQQQFNLSLIGQTEEAQAGLRAAYEVTTAAREKQLEIERKIADLSRTPALAATNAAQIAALRNEQQQIADSTAETARNIGDAAAQTVIANRDAQAWKSTFDEINRTLVDSFLKAFEDIRHAGQSLRDGLKSIFENFVVRPILQATLAPVSAGITSVLTGQAPAGAGLLSSVPNLSGLANLFGLGGGASLPIGSALGNLGTIIPTLMQTGSFSAAFAGMLPSFMALVPWAGLIAAAVPLISGLFKRGGPKFEGEAGTAVDLGTGALSSTSAFPRTITAHIADADIQKLTNGIASDYRNAANLLGARSGAVSFSQGFAVDTKGDAPSIVHTGAFVNGQQVFRGANENVGRTDEALQSELTLQAKRAVLAALQATDLPAYVGTVLGTVDAASGTAQQIDDIVAAAEAIKQLGDAFPDFAAAMNSLSAEQVTALADAFGGIGAFTQSTAYLFQNFTTNADKLNIATARVNQGFADLGLAVPKTHAGLLALYNTAIAAGDPQLAAHIAALAPDFVLLNGTAEQAAAGVQQAADALAQLRQSAQDYFNQNFLSPAERQQLNQNTVAHAGDAFDPLLGDTRGNALSNLGFSREIPTTIQGFHDFILALRATGKGGEYLADIFVHEVGPSIVSLNTNADKAADSINALGHNLDTLYNLGHAAAGGVNDAANAFAGMVRGGTFEKLTAQLNFYAGQIADTQNRLASPDEDYFQRGIDTTKLNDLNKLNAGLAADLARFVSLRAQYGNDIAEQLFDLQKTYDDNLHFFDGNTQALADYNAIFQKNWTDIINGTTEGASKLQGIYDNIRDYLIKLTASDLSPKSPADQFRDVQWQFRDDLGLARGGNQDALQRLTQDADSYLQLARQLYRSSPDYTTVFNEVTSTLHDLLPTGAENPQQTVANAMPTDSPVSSQNDIRALQDQVVILTEEVSRLLQRIASDTADVAASSDQIVITTDARR